MGAGGDIVKSTVKTPFEIAGIGFRLGRSAPGFLVRSVVGLPGRRNHNFAEDLRQQRPLDRVLIAVDDIHDGQARKLDKPELDKLVQVCSATVVHALIDGEGDPEVPDDVTTAAAQVAAAEGIDLHTPLVPAELADQAEAVVQTHLPNGVANGD